MKWIKYIASIIILFVAVAVSISGVVAVFENIVEPKLTGIVAGILTIAIGLYVGKVGLKIFRQEKFKLSKMETPQKSVGE